MRGLSGKVAVVTGAAGGIGRATAQRLVDEGAVVVCADVARTPLLELVEAMGGAEGQVVPLALDVTDRDGVRRAFGDVVREHGTLDALVNAHGVYHQGEDGQGPVEATSPEDWQLVLSVNLMGVVHTSEAALTHMKRQRGGRIVNVSSVAGAQGGYASGAAYSVSKAGVTCFTKCVAREGAAFGITANAVAPGQIDTAMTEIVMQRVPLASIVERTPLGRLGQAEEVASAIVFLCSADASFITGQMLGVNGGLLMA